MMVIECRGTDNEGAKIVKQYKTAAKTVKGCNMAIRRYHEQFVKRYNTVKSTAYWAISPLPDNSAIITIEQ